MSSRSRSAHGALAALLMAVLAIGSNSAQAAPWAEVGDRSLRNDIEILHARGLIDGPITTWPIPVGFFSALHNAQSLVGQPEYVQLAAQRVLARLDGHNNDGQPLHAAGTFRLSSEPNLIRDFGDNARDEADIRAGLDYENERFAANLRVGALSNIDGDGYRFALDGTYVTALLGNWQLYGGYIDKWYGPGYTSSLILSNNARPFPKIGITRNNSTAFETPWLSWLGRYQIDFFVGLLEEDARDDRNTGVGSIRISIEPINGLELTVTRVSQFCGGDNACKPFRAAFGINNTDKDRNASNDEGTFEIKYTYDFNVVSFSPYLQIMNEDTGPFTHSYESHMGGLSWAGPWDQNGASWRLVAEYTDSRATLDAFSFGNRVTGLAYNNDQYTDGFRYRGRTMGFSLDSDSTLFTVSGLMLMPNGWTYRAAFHNAHISTAELAAAQASGSILRNTVSAQPVTVNQYEAGVTIPWQSLSFDLGVRYQDEQPFPDVGSQFNVEAGVQLRF
ncbi:MAG: capsule assembly Wzi family protein [Nevskia sp.]|nr:capsule assembly Wzi family protein [Nevskia sp.]